MNIRSSNILNFIFFLQLTLFLSNTNISIAQNENKWTVESPIFESGPQGTFDEVAVKDPSIVFFKNAWHLFYTARGNDQYTTGYVSAKDLKTLNSNPRYELTQIRGKERYGCAPQIFYFSPQEKWYLIYQNRDANYQPVFSTNPEIQNPNSWTNYELLVSKDEERKWIDFWVIAHEEKVYLFYTVAKGGVMVRTTSITDFPNSWSKSKQVFDEVHEAVHVYKVKGKNEFHMFYELNNNGTRSFGLAKSNKLDEGWVRETDHYASGNQLLYNKGSDIWTEMVSHGEVIRSGYDEKMEYESENCQWIIQGILKKDLELPYPSLPWKLGIITK